MTPSPPTISEIWRFLLSAKNDDEFESALEKAREWPPDVFCLAAAVLKQANAYTWLPSTTARRLAEDETRNFQKFLARGGKWNEVISKKLWKSVTKYADRREPLYAQESVVTGCAGNRELLEGLYRLLVISDHACAGFGLPMGNKDTKYKNAHLVQFDADEMLEPKEFGSSLCKTIHHTRARVLPKTHTPASGLTFRSLSHHLCFLEGDEGIPLWYTVPGGPIDVNRLNVLLVPEPRSIRPSQFSDQTEHHSFRPAAEKHRLFSFEPENTCGELTKRVNRLCEIAEQQVGSVDVVVLPELAVHASDYRLLRRSLLSRRITLVAGIGGTTQEGLRENRVGLDIPIGKNHAVHLRQRKHHKWRLDESQIRKYQLSSVLDTSRIYWEDLEIGDRHLCFVALHPTLLASVLICEDLARSEPVGELVRAVGPNLVIALLMDGPQFKSRWSSRYATVLAEDPGCSVLCVTSLGLISRFKIEDDQKASQSKPGNLRVIALWKDTTQEKELALDEGAHALLLTLNMSPKDEWTYDLRHYPAVNPILSGCEQICDDGRDPDAGRFDESKAMHNITLLAPIEASALARLTRLDSPDDLAGHYREILSRLGPEARRIALHMVELRAGHTGSTGNEEKSGSSLEGQHELFSPRGFGWYQSKRVDAEVIATAQDILRWRKRSENFAPDRVDPTLS